MVQTSDRFRFRPQNAGFVPAQDVTVTRVVGDNFWCKFKRYEAADAEVFCQFLEVPGYGMLEPSEGPPAKQHDQITLEDWRAKARSRDWPRGS